jgi:DNA-binding NarL/FixJ family response regulator
MPVDGKLTVVLADGDAVVRGRFAALCAAHGMRVLVQCADGPTAVDTILRLQPSLGIVDLQLRGTAGIGVVRELRAAACRSKLLLLSASDDESLVPEALRCGADGYLLKGRRTPEVLDAIRFVLDGGIYVSPLSQGTRPARPFDENPLARLSPREAEVFTYLIRGRRAKEIAELLAIKPKTVDTYRAGLMRKLNVRGLVGLVRFAIERNLTSASSSGS